MSKKGLLELSKQGLLCGDKISKLKFCETCVLWKAKQVKLNTVIHKSEGILDYIHSDLWGPAKVQSKGGSKYFMTLIDDYSRRVWVFLLKTKDRSFIAFK